MKIFICGTCRQGYDIQISGGINCPECGGKKWDSINKLPSSAGKYREKWAKEFGIMICDDEADIDKRKLSYLADRAMEGVNEGKKGPDG